MRELATIVVPVFEENWRSSEYTLLLHARHKLPGFTFVFVCADEYHDGPIRRDFPGSTIYRFDPSFFTDKREFTRLLLKEEFYDMFGWSEFLLILLGGAFIVKNELHYWCKQGHDYISDSRGRFSLRNVDRFLSQIRKNQREIHKFLSTDSVYENDRLFWEKKTKGFWPALRNPTPVVSAYFSQPVVGNPAEFKSSELPFAFTDFDKDTEEHRGWLGTLLQQ